MLKRSVAFLLTALCITLPLSGETRWDWDVIAQETHNFDPAVLAPELRTIPHWGAGSSCLQSAGLETAGDIPTINNWTEWLEKKGYVSIGNASESWQKFEDDIRCLKELGLNTYRFSVEWSKVEPVQGHYNEEALAWYSNFTNALIAAGIKPIPTLFHHAWPAWTNGFEDESCIDAFTNFSAHTYAYIMDRTPNAAMADTWITLNEPVGYAMAAYVDGSYPPGHKKEFCACGKVVYNFLRAHCSVYDALHTHAQEKNYAVKIGIAQVFNPIQAYRWYNPADSAIAYYMNYLLNDAALQFFKTGHFYWMSGLSNGTKIHDPEAPTKLDWIGVNYYSHTLIGNFKTQKRADEILSDTSPGKPAKSLYAEGFYDAIKQAATLCKPVWVTENGFAAADDSEKRTTFFQRHLYAIRKAIQDGITIEGYLVWTLVDGYEWNAGASNYGLFTRDRVLKPNTEYFQQILNLMPCAGQQ